MASTNLKIIPPVIAHRGASAYAPENTFIAFKKAKEQGAHWIEFDVMLAACGEVIVFHDEILDRTTNATGKVSDFTYDDLKKLDAGSWFHSQFAHEKIPTLRGIVLFLEKYSLNANIELKALPGKESEIVKNVLHIIDQYWPSNISPPLLSSFSVDVLTEIRRYSASYQLGLLMDEVIPGWEKLDEELQCVSLNLNQKWLNPTLIKTLKKTGKPILSYTVNDYTRASELFSWGVDAVFTDCPDKILRRR